MNNYNIGIIFLMNAGWIGILMITANIEQLILYYQTTESLCRISSKKVDFF